MAALAFLGVALVVIVVGVTVVLLRNREPRGEHLGIEEFRREMRALAPDRPVEPDAAGVRIIGRPTGEE